MFTIGKFTESQWMTNEKMPSISFPGKLLRTTTVSRQTALRGTADTTSSTLKGRQSWINSPTLICLTSLRQQQECSLLALCKFTVFGCSTRLAPLQSKQRGRLGCPQCGCSPCFIRQPNVLSICNFLCNCSQRKLERHCWENPTRGLHPSGHSPSVSCLSASAGLDVG